MFTENPSYENPYLSVESKAQQALGEKDWELEAGGDFGVSDKNEVIMEA